MKLLYELGATILAVAAELFVCLLVVLAAMVFAVLWLLLKCCAWWQR